MNKFAYVFPGQGSQEVGMLADVERLVADDFKAASEALGYDLWSLVQTGPAEKLGQTEFTQPALLTASTALFRLAREQGAPAPTLVAGHSLGEYSALVAADVLSLADAARLVQQRGQFMQTAVPLGEGGMAAVMKLDDADIERICTEASQQGLVQAANFNAPGQVVIAGDNKTLAAAVHACKEAGGRVMPLAVSAPFHSQLMQPAADKMAEALAAVTFNKPTVPVLQNVDASLHTDPDEIKNNLVAQMHSPVLWTASVMAMAKEGIDTVIECGPGKVLAGLIRRTDANLTSHNINDAQSLSTTVEALAA
ncbi:MAG: ACP S-malonyltransferase [Pseudomonadales bacterium]